jgi:hypothetical protein
MLITCTRHPIEISARLGIRNWHRKASENFQKMHDLPIGAISWKGIESEKAESEKAESERAESEKAES